MRLVPDTYADPLPSRVAVRSRLVAMGTYGACCRSCSSAGGGPLPIRSARKFPRCVPCGRVGQQEREAVPSLAHSSRQGSPCRQPRCTRFPSTWIWILLPVGDTETSTWRSCSPPISIHTMSETPRRSSHWTVPWVTFTSATAVFLYVALLLH
jgi:hypothetical protein